MSDTHKGKLPRNPLGVIAVFVFFIEVIATVSLRIVVGSTYARPVVYFIIWYPVGITAVFFVILWFRREVLFGPMDYREDQTFKDILLRRVEALQVRQEANEIEVTTNLRYVYATIDRLIDHNEVDSAIIVGRTFLKNGLCDISYDLFQHIHSKVSKQHEHYYMLLGNIAFSLIQKHSYREALEYIAIVESADDGKHFFSWHALARAYAIYKSGNGEKADEYWAAIKMAKAKSEYKLDLHNARRIYPEIGEDLNL